MIIVAISLVLHLLQDTHGGLAPPSYVSDWVWMDSDDAPTTDVTFSHNFGVRPVKAEVQVRSPDTGFIYPGVRSAHCDNDNSNRGGVIALYGENDVRLFGATNDGSSTQGFIIYTGLTSWRTENGETLLAAHVRVRLWHPDDLPPPSYTTSLTMAAEMLYGYPNYMELPHNQAGVPALTVVQYYSTDSSNYLGTVVAEAQGTNQLQVAQSSSTTHEASFVFAVGESNIRLWAASNVDGVYYKMFSYCDGWGTYITTVNSCSFRTAYVNISVWSSLDAEQLYTGLSHHTVSDTTGHELSTVPFDPSADIITVTSTPTYGNNQGFYFDGTGAAMTDGVDKSAGLVYAYKDTGQLRVWHPSYLSYCIIQVGPSMGENTNNQCADDVMMSVNIWKALSCTWIEIPNAVATGGPLIITYECNFGSVHVSGDLQRVCQESGTWNGTLPECKQCEPLETGVSVQLDTKLLRTLNIANFTCVDGYDFHSGNLTRECGLPNAAWSGQAPVCGVPATTTSTAPTTTSTTPTTTSTPTTSTTTTITTSTTSPTTSTSTIPPNTTVSSTTLSATSITSDSPSSTTQPAVVQVCYNTTTVVYNATTLEAQTQQIVANLTVDAKSTSKYARSKESARDDRPSSMYIGLAGALIFALVCGLFLIPDVVSILRFLLRGGYSRYNVSEDY